MTLQKAIEAAEQAGETAASFEARLQRAFHLHRIGDLENAHREVQIVLKDSDSPRLRFDADLCQANIQLQEIARRGGQEADTLGLLAERYHALRTKIQNDDLQFTAKSRLARQATLLWREGYVRLLTGRELAATNLFARHRDVAGEVPHQRATQLIFCRCMPQLLSADNLVEVTSLNEAIESTGRFEELALGILEEASIFTYSDIGRLERDFLLILASARDRSEQDVYYHAARLMFRLDRLRTSLDGNPVSELLLALDRHRELETVGRVRELLTRIGRGELSTVLAYARDRRMAWKGIARAIEEQEVGAPEWDSPQLSGLKLTKREREVLTLLKRGVSNSEIGKKLAIQKRTVERHLQNVYEKVPEKEWGMEDHADNKHEVRSRLVRRLGGY